MDKLESLLPKVIDVDEGYDEKSYLSSADGFPSDNGWGNWNQEVVAYLDLMTLKSLFYNDRWVFITVNFLARKIANQNMLVHRLSIRKGELVSTPWAFHDLNENIKKPNQYEGYCNFMYKVAAELAITGNAVIWKQRFSEQLILIPSESVIIEYDNDLKPMGYSVTQGNIGEHGLERAYTIHVDDIIHIKLPNPNSMYWGLSAWVPGRKSVLFDRYSQEYLLDFYLKQATPGQIMELTNEANEKKAVRFLKSLELGWAGRQNQRRTMILPKGVKAVTQAHKISEQNLAEHIQLNKEAIMGLFSIPPHAFGTQDTGSIGSEETEKQMRNFWENTGIPYENIISEGFTDSYADELGRRYRYQFDNSNIPSLREDTKKQAETAQLMLATHTVNEVRAKIYKDGPVEGGDKLQSSTPAQANPFQGFQLPEKQAITEIGQTPESRKLRKFLMKHGEWWGKKQDSERDLQNKELKYLEEVFKIFLDYAPEAIEAFYKVYGKKAVAGIIYKQEYSCKDSRDDMRKELDRRWEQFDDDYTKNLEPIIIESGESGYELALETPFELANREEQEVLQAEGEEGRRETLAARGIESFKGIQKSTTNQILDLIAQGTQESKTVSQIARDISEYFKEIIPKRAETIARTEVLVASSIGQESAFQDAKKIDPGIAKYWVTVGDGRVRGLKPSDKANHVELDGTQPSSEGKFANGLRFPRDPLGPAHEVINCRCTFLMVPSGDSIDVGSIDRPDLLPGQLDDTAP